ncbi:MAG: WD40 repeat domain-containing protein, partial [Planctomycetes bacterium]|nr:WD40 repeat domain-containing protein [Planctomycetota bacterium]
MSDNSESCEREIRLRWDERTELVATLFGDVALVDEVVLTKTDLVTGQQDSLRLSAPMTFEITGLIRATEQHVLVGIRNSAICVDVVMLIETSRIRENSHGAPADEDAVGEETLARGAFAFDHERRLLFMLCGYYDQAAFYCYKVSANYRTWTRKNRREVCDYCPRGQSDLVSPAGICVLPESGNVAAIFLLEQIIIPIAEDQEPPRQGRLCWVAEFSNRADVWVEIVQPFSDDFIGNNTVIKMADRTFIEQGSAEFWQPTPVAIDSGRVAFVTHSGKVLLTEITTGSTSCLQQLHAKHASLSFDSSTNELVAILDDDQTTRIPVPSLGYSNLTTFVGSRTVVRPRKPKSHRPPRLPEPPRQPICWSVGKPLALSTNGSIAVAGRYVIDLVRNRTLCVLPDFGEKIRKVAVTPNGSRVVTNDGIVRILDGRSGQLIAETTSAREFDINPCGQCLALVDFANLSVWNLESGQLMRESPHGGNHISWSPDGRRIAFGGWTGGIVPKPDGRPGLQSVDCNRLTIWDFENWQAITEFSPGDIG